MARFFEWRVKSSTGAQSREKPREGLWLNNGFCVRLQQACGKRVWSYNFESAPTIPMLAPPQFI
jgi:hypothetical protein